MPMKQVSKTIQILNRVSNESAMDTLPKTFPTKTVDRALAAMDGFFTPVIQLEMVFDEPLDEKRLARALYLTMDAEPLLGCRFAGEAVRPYWERVEKENFTVFTVTSQGAEYDAFKQRGIDFFAEPQILACLFRSGLSDRLTLKISHLVSDAAGVKEIAAKLSFIYNRLEHEPDFKPDPGSCDFRSFWEVASQVPWYLYPKIVINFLSETTKSLIPFKSHHVPIEKGFENSGTTITRHIERDQLSAMVRYGKKHDATINDVLMAAIFRALSRIGKWDGKAALRMAITVDLRRYLPGSKAKSVANFSAMEILTYGRAIEDDFKSTLARIVDMINKRKASWLGLSGFISLYPLLWALPFSVLKPFSINGWESKADSANSYDWFTNMGNIPMECVRFGGNPSRAWLLPPGCNSSLFFFGCSSYNGTLSISASIASDENAENEAAAQHFFDLVIAELPIGPVHRS